MQDLSKVENSYKINMNILNRYMNKRKGISFSLKIKI